MQSLAGRNTIRVLSRTAINPGGANLGDSYVVLYEAPTLVSVLGEERIGIQTACQIDFECCTDLIVELELCACGGKIQRRVHPTYRSAWLIVFTVIE